MKHGVHKMRILYGLVSVLFATSVLLSGCSSQQQQGSETGGAGDTGAGDTAVETETDYPSRSISYVIPFAAGGGTDVQGRVFVQFFNQELPEEVIVSNITGSSGTIGANDVLNAPADGYMILHGYAGWPIPYLMGNAEFTYKDFDTLCMFSQSQYAVLVKSDAPWETIEDLVADAKANPGEIRAGMGTGQQGHAAALLLGMGAGAEFKFIDIGGTVPKPPELLAGRVDFYCDPLPSAEQYLESGDFRCLGIFSNEPVEGIEYPALGEVFGTNMSLPTQNGIWLRKGTPDNVKQVLLEAAEKTCSNPEYIEACERLSIQPCFMGEEEYQAYLEEEFALYEQIFA